jgi:hypothetical protein
MRIILFSKEMVQYMCPENIEFHGEYSVHREYSIHREFGFTLADSGRVWSLQRRWKSTGQTIFSVDMDSTENVAFTENAEV